MNNLAGERGFIHRTGHPIYLIIECLPTWITFWWADIGGHKCLHILVPFGDIYPYTSSPDVSFTNFPIMLFPHPWPSSQYTGHNWFINQWTICLQLLPTQLSAHVHCPNFCALWRFPSTGVFQGCFRRSCSAVAAYWVEPSLTYCLALSSLVS